MAQLARIVLVLLFSIILVLNEYPEFGGFSVGQSSGEVGEEAGSLTGPSLFADAWKKKFGGYGGGFKKFGGYGGGFKKFGHGGGFGYKKFGFKKHWG